MPRPAQLPAPVGHFTGRSQELALLDEVVAGEHRDTRVVAISGAAGIGKTALAVHWAHRVADRFPDGQLFVDLRGHESQRAASPEDTLSYLLRSLGIPADRIPSDIDERGSLYRSVLHERRVLIVLDNGGPIDRILPLVPAGTGNLLMVTSRHPLHSLVAHHAVRLIRLAALTGGEAQALLRGLLSAEQVGGDPDAVAELSEVCDRLPLALRIAAAKLAGAPHRTARQLVTELSGADRLDRFTVDGDSRSVRAVFASAYGSLTDPAARLFRQLGLAPAGTVHTQLAAALAGTSTAATRLALDELLGAHLITEVAADRYGCHDLVRLFAQQRATMDDPAPNRDETLTRALDWYLAMAYAANQLIDPGRDRVTPVLEYPPGELPFPADRPAALAFLDTERENLPLVIRHAAEHGPGPAAAQLTYLLTGFYDVRGHWTERVQICQWAVQAAGNGDDPGLHGLMRSALGVAYIMTRQYDRALEQLHLALPLMRAAQDRRGEGHVYNNIAAAHSGLRQFDAAVEAFGQALAVHSSNGNHLGVALALNNTGHTYVRMGEAGRGAPDLLRALGLSRDIGNRWLQAAVLHSLGEASLGQGDPDGAVDYFARAHEEYRQLGDRRHEAEMMTGLGQALLDQGRRSAALEQLGAALTLAREVGDQHLEAVTRCHLGRAQLDDGDLTAARYDLHTALALRQLTPDRYEEAQVHRLLGEVERRRGDPDRAEWHWRTAIDLLRKENATSEADELAGRLPAGRPVRV